MLEQLAFQPPENTENLQIQNLDGFQDVIGFFSLFAKIEKRNNQQVVNVQEENNENDRNSNTHNPKI
jgi:hypothetical protein